MINTDVNVFISSWRLSGSASINSELMTLSVSLLPASAGHGLRLGVKRRAHVLHPELGLQHLPTWDHFPRRAARLREAQPSVRICCHGSGQRGGAPLRYGHGAREDGKHQRRSPGVLPACVSIRVVCSKTSKEQRFQKKKMYADLWAWCLEKRTQIKPNIKNESVKNVWSSEPLQ